MARSKRIQRHYLHKESVFTVFCQKRFGKFLVDNNSYDYLFVITLAATNHIGMAYPENLSFEESIITSLNWIHPIFGRCLFGSFDENDGNILE